MEPPQDLFQRVMLVAAHPDDGEFMAAGTLAKWAREGKEVYYVVCTSGDKGSSDPTVNPQELARVREWEQQAAASLVGAREVVFLRYPDGVLVNTLKLRRDITRQIRRLKPDMVVCMDPTVMWWERGLNHPDHRAAGAAALDAVFPSSRDYHVFPELIREGLLPHKVRQVCISGPGTNSNFFVDITETVDIKLAALKEHKSQMGEDPERLAHFELEIRQWLQQLGSAQGMKYAEGFHRIVLTY